MRFSLKALLLIVGIVALYCCLLTSLPDAVSYVAITVIQGLLLPPTVAGMVYGRANLRAFCIGCFPFAATCWVLGVVVMLNIGSNADDLGELIEDLAINPPDLFHSKAWFAMLIPMMITSGLLAIAVRTLTRQSRTTLPSSMTCP